MFLNCFFILLSLSLSLATYINIPGCASLYQFDFQSLSENDTQPTCYCDNSTDYSTDLVQINCIFGSTLDDLSVAIEQVNEAKKTVNKLILERLYVNDDPYQAGIPDSYFIKQNVTPSEITLKYCREPNILGENSLKGLEKYLTNLEISECVFSDVPSGINKLANLQNLDLSYNGITTIRKDDLSQLTNLRTLDLTGNGMTTVEEGSFKDLKSLEELMLGQNALNATVLKEISQLTNLIYLNLKNNLIETPADGVFKKLTNLTGIHFETNLITGITAKTFDGLTNLKYLNMFENLIKTIEPNSFAKLPSLEVVSLRTNFLPEILQETFASNTMKTLNLVFNDLSVLKKDSFKLTPNLEELNFGVNSKLSVVDPGAFNGLAHLQQLNLSYSNLSSFDSSILKPTPNLNELDISNTQITSLKKNAFENVRNLTVLRIADTKLQTLPEGIFDKLDNLYLLDLYNNKWICDKGLAWLIKWIKSKSSVVETNGTPYCDSPKELANMTLFEVDINKLQ